MTSEGDCVKKESQVREQLNSINIEIDELENQVNHIYTRISIIQRNPSPNKEEIGKDDVELVPLASELRGISRRLHDIVGVMVDNKNRIEL